VDVPLRLDGVSKRYGPTLAVDDLSFSVPSGLVTGFVGPNGAGKSTTLRILLGLARPSAGTALVCGGPYAALESPLRTVGALLETRAAHPGRSARDHLRWMARSSDLPERRVDDVLDQVELTSVARRRVGGFSLGMAQRLGLAAALLGDPGVLILDEPSNGLDPDGIRWLRGLLRGLADEGRAVLVASHLLAELEGTADRVVVMAGGRLLADETVAALLDGGGPGRATLEDAYIRLTRAAGTGLSQGGHP
jgi:ABC-2 type transport system ATP-binding protein